MFIHYEYGFLFQVFSREDYLEDDKVATAIKVTNSKLRLCTFWDVPKFEDKLAQMRDLYQVWYTSTLTNDSELCRVFFRKFYI